MTTKAMPLSAGIAAKKLLNASSPPAEAPMPTISCGPRGVLAAAAALPAGTASVVPGASGLWGVPSFRVGDLAVWGQDRLWAVQEALLGPYFGVTL